MGSALWISKQVVLICTPHGRDGIYHGEEAEFSDFKYSAKFFIYEGVQLKECGGGVIDEFHILTAAHCVASVQPDAILILVGTNHIQKSSLFWEVERSHVHPDYKPLKTLSCMELRIRQLLPCIFDPPIARILPKNDIAVLKTVQIMPLGLTITKIDLPESDSLPYCEELRYAAWGHIEESTITNHLQCTTLITIEQEECFQYFFQPREDTFCAGTATGISSIAHGDSGSPLIYENIVYGITSFIGHGRPDLPAALQKSLAIEISLKTPGNLEDSEDYHNLMYISR